MSKLILYFVLDTSIHNLQILHWVFYNANIFQVPNWLKV